MKSTGKSHVGGGAPPPAGDGILSSGLEHAHDGLGAKIRAVDKALGGKTSQGARLAFFGELSRAIADHFRFEEESLFPNLLLVTGDQASAAVNLLQKEHVELLRHLEATGSALRSGAEVAAAKRAFEGFRKLLSTHQAREMSLVYPLSDLLLPPSLRKIIAEQLAGGRPSAS